MRLTRPSLLVILGLSQSAFAADVIAHRGYACGSNENSLASVSNAWQAGADGVELDVRVSTDGIPYLFHDEEISGVRVDELTFAQVDDITSVPLVTLQSLFHHEALTGYYLLDLKSNLEGQVAALLEVVGDSDLSKSQLSFQSTSLSALATIRAAFPESRTYYLSHLKWRIPYLPPPSAKALVERLKSTNVDGVSIKGRRFIDREFVTTLKSAGLDVNVWTINEPRRASHYHQLDVDGLITDNVSMVLNELDRTANNEQSCR